MALDENQLVQLLAQLRRDGVTLWVEEAQLRFRAPQGRITSSLRETLKENREPLIKLILASSEGAPVNAPASQVEHPLSHMQQRLWFLKQMQPGLAAYNIPLAVRMTGELDVVALERAFDVALSRQNSLRTRFVENDGVPRCIVEAAVRLPLRRHDASHEPEEIRESSAMALIEEFAHQSFGPSDCPLLRALLVRLGNDQYILSLVVDHLVADGLSLDLLVAEIFTAYARHVAVEPASSSPPPLTLQYADFVAWQQRRVEAGAADRCLQYWKTTLANLPPLLPLPTDLPRPSIQTYNGDHAKTVVPHELTARLKALARTEGATLFMVMMAAYQVLLHRYTGATDIPVGTAVANRGEGGFDKLVGFFANNIVMRGNLSGNPTCREAVARMRTVALGAYAHDELQFELLVEALSPARGLDHSPIFQVMFVLRQGGGDSFNIAGLKLASIESPLRTSRYDLTLDAIERPNGSVELSFEFNTDLFLASTIERVADNFGRLLDGMATNPECRISDIPLLAERELTDIRRFGAGLAAQIPEGAFHEHFEVRARDQPGHPAASFKGAILTYAQLNASANQIAHALGDLGVGRGSKVALCMERSAQLLPALLGIQKSGAAYVPLDPGFPAERLAYMLEDSGASVLVTAGGAADHIQLPQQVQILDLMTEAKRLAAQPDVDLPIKARAEDPAYIIYTSGSTGRPKGVLVSHGALLNFLRSMAHEPGLGEQDVLAAVTTISFDIAGLELYLPLLVGARVELVSREEAVDGQALAARLRSSGATVLQATPATWRLLIESGWQGAPGFRAFCGGEPLPQALADTLLSRVTQLWNLYGPTETTVWSTLEQVRAGEPITVGRPIANTQVYVLGAGMERMPVGSPGEIWIGGAGVALGYHARPELTAERFVNDPFSTHSGAKLYRTGDLGRWNRQGKLEHLGRADAQVKIRGYRIELGEIEAVMEHCAGVSHAAVVVKQAATGDERLVGAVVVDGEEQQVLTAVRARLREVLPEYMVPQELVRLDALPLTANGKVDRKTLAETLAVGGHEETRTIVPPATATEQQVWDVYREVLEQNLFGTTDSFFDLGGHSLIAARLMSRLRAAFGLDLPLRLLFEHPTVAQMAAVIDRLAAGDTDDLSRREQDAVSAPQLPMTRVLRSPQMPLSNAQRRLWFMRQMHPESSYVISSLFRWTGTVDVSALDRTLVSLVRRHESLRMRFFEGEGSPFYSIDDAAPSILEHVVLEAGEQQERMEEALRLVHEYVQRQFDLSRSPLMKVCLVSVNPQLHLLCLVVDHIISDGLSVAILANELSRLYAGEVKGQPASLPSLEFQYPDYADWLGRELSAGAMSHLLAYWKPQLSGMAPALPLPLDFRRPVAQTFEGQRRGAWIPDALTGEVRALAKAEGTTLFMVLLGLFQAMLSRSSGVTDIPVGTAVANRNRPEAEPMVGFFVNNLVMRGDLSGDPTARELLQRTRSMALDAFAHQEMPFESLVEALMPPRQMALSPLFQVLFVLHGAVTGRGELPGGVLESAELLTLVARYDLSVDVFDVDGRLRMYFEYNSDLFLPETIDRMIEHYLRILQAAVSDPNARVREFPMLTQGEIEQLHGIERGASEQDWWQGVFPDVFAHVSEARAAAMAVRCGEHGLTYGELNASANQIAHALGDLGVGRGSKVALCMERSEQLLPALLGIQKSGAAYVPLDPGFPAERLAYMLEDSGASVLVTTGGATDHIELPQEVRVLDLLAEAQSLAAQPDVELPIKARAEDPAYIIYTSGSTGRPKGVVVSHGALLNFLRSMAQEPGLGEQDVLAAVTTISFDIAGLELYLPLLVGARVELVSRQEAVDGQALAARLRSSGATVLQATPATWRLLIESGWQGAPGFRAFCGGEALPQALADALLPRVTQLWNLYGPTETTVWSTLSQVHAGEPITVGRPIANTQVYVLGAGMERMPVGSPGEIWIGGAGVALGYHARPELTAERFVDDPFSTHSGAKLYRTGDLGRWNREGKLEHLGRADGQVKIRGYRIELGEIEAVMERCAGVSHAAVVVKQAVAGDERLVGAVVIEGDEQQVLTALRARLRELLPEYMVPQELVRLDALPLTANGKVDRKTLAEGLVSGAHEEVRTVVPPATATEQQVWDVYREVLEQNLFGTTDSFFDLGGHSLIAARLMSRLRAAFGLDLPLRLLFEHPTVAQMAAVIDRTAHGDADNFASAPGSVVRLHAGSGDGEMPVIALPGHNGDVFCYRSFASEQSAPLYALQPPGVDGQSLPLSDLDSLADYFLEQVTAFRADGQFIVMGYCAGGSVAAQLARRLEAKGRLKALVLIGSQHPRHYQTLAQLQIGWRWLGIRIAHHARAVLSAGVGGAIRYLAERLRGSPRKPSSTDSSPVDPVLAARQRVEVATIQALRGYRGGSPLQAPVALLVPPTLWFRTHDEILAAWREIGTDVREFVCDISDHGDEMLRPPHLTAVLQQYHKFLASL